MCRPDSGDRDDGGTLAQDCQAKAAVVVAVFHLVRGGGSGAYALELVGSVGHGGRACAMLLHLWCHVVTHTKRVVQDADGGLDGGGRGPVALIRLDELKGECGVVLQGRAPVFQGAKLGPDLRSVHSVGHDGWCLD